MTQDVTKRRFLGGWRQWLKMTLACRLVIALVLAFALWRQATVARDCRQATPLSKEVHPVAPGADVPEAVARFAGVWSEVWRPRGLIGFPILFRNLARGQSFIPLCQTLIVEEIRPKGYARLIFSYEASAAVDTPFPNLLRVTGRIVNGELRFQLPLLPVLPSFSHRIEDEVPDGSFGLPDQVITSICLTRVTDLNR